jgi:adenylyl-sulfate kinase
VTTSANVVWHAGGVDRELRRRQLGLSGATVWFTGLPSSGKSTLARALEDALVARGTAAYVLDGDNLRHGLNGDLGFDEDSRRENVRRTAEVARLFADAGVIALVSLVSPYGADRARARAMHDAEGVRFIEVYVNRSVEECERRDPKGLYARARRGEIPAFTGVDAPYEAPRSPDLELTDESVEDAVRRLLPLLEIQVSAAQPRSSTRGFLPNDGPTGTEEWTLPRY